MVYALVGCAPQPPADESAFHKHYSPTMERLRVPSAAAVQAVGAKWTFDVPCDAAWQASLKLASQYGAILSLERNGSSRTLLLLNGLQKMETPGEAEGHATFGKLFDRWFAVAVEEQGNRTTVATAWVNPATGKLQRGVGTTDEFLYQLEVQLHGADRWIKKYVVDWDRIQARQGIKVVSPPDFSAYRQLEMRIGAWVSKRLLLRFPVIECPDMERVIAGMLRRLDTVLEVRGHTVRAHIIASPDVSAFALPNGEIFVCAGLLDVLQTPGQLAAALAHELMHVHRHDTVQRLQTARSGRAAEATFSVFMSVATQAVAFAGGAGFGADVGRSLASGTLEAARTAGSAAMGTAMVEAYSADAELRADAEGARLAYAAGFDLDDQIGMLETLQSEIKSVQQRQGLIVSNLVNKRPGLAERLAAMKAIKQLLEKKD